MTESAESRTGQALMNEAMFPYDVHAGVVAASLVEMSDDQPDSHWHDVHVGFSGEDPGAFKVGVGPMWVKVVDESGTIVPIEVHEFVAQRVYPESEDVDSEVRQARIAEVSTAIGRIQGRRAAVRDVGRAASSLVRPVHRLAASQNALIIPFDDFNARLRGVR